MPELLKFILQTLIGLLIGACVLKTSSVYRLYVLLRVLDIKTEAIKGLPGRSFYKSLLGESRDGDDRIVVFDEYGPVRMIRTRNFKYVHRFWKAELVQKLYFIFFIRYDNIY